MCKSQRLERDIEVVEFYVRRYDERSKSHQSCAKVRISNDEAFQVAKIKQNNSSNLQSRI